MPVFWLHWPGNTEAVERFNTDILLIIDGRVDILTLLVQVLSISITVLSAEMRNILKYEVIR